YCVGHLITETVSFFLSEPADTDISPLSYTTLFRSQERNGAKQGNDQPQHHHHQESITQSQLGVVPVHRHPQCQTNRERSREGQRSEEHSLNSSHVKISYAVFCLKKKRYRNKTDRAG